MQSGLGLAFPVAVQLILRRVDPGVICSEWFSGGGPEQCGSEGRPAGEYAESGSAIGDRRGPFVRFTQTNKDRPGASSSSRSTPSAS